MPSLTTQNTLVHNYLWTKKQYLRDKNNTESLIQTSDFFQKFDGVTVSFWECNDVPMECKWEHERDRGAFYFDGLFSGACAPSLMRLHDGGRLTHVSSSVYHGSYDITLQSPQAGYATDTGDFVVSVTMTLAPDTRREDIQARISMPQVLGRVYMKLHTFPVEEALAFFQEYPNQQEQTPYDPWILGIAANLTTRNYLDHIEQHETDAERFAEEARQSALRALTSELRATARAESAHHSTQSAHTSETNAERSETTANMSETNAERSSDSARQNAEQSEIHMLQASTAAKLVVAANITLNIADMQATRDSVARDAETATRASSQTESDRLAVELSAHQAKDSEHQSVVAAQLSTENAHKTSELAGSAEDAARCSVRAAHISTRYIWALVICMLVMALVLYYYLSQRCKHHP